MTVSLEPGPAFVRGHILSALGAFPVTRVGGPPRPEPTSRPARIVVVDLPPIARHADVERPPAVAAPKVYEILARAAVHPLARAKLDGRREPRDSLRRASIRARGAGLSRPGPHSASRGPPSTPP